MNAGTISLKNQWANSGDILQRDSGDIYRNVLLTSTLIKLLCCDEHFLLLQACSNGQYLRRLIHALQMFMKLKDVLGGGGGGGGSPIKITKYFPYTQDRI